MPLLKLQEGIWHELRVDIQGMRPPLLAMLPQVHSRLTVLPRFQSRASNTLKESQGSTSRRMALYGSFATTAAHSHVNTGYVSPTLIRDLIRPRKHDLIRRSQQEQAADKFRYITYGTLDDPEQLPPKGEFFCKERASWMPKIPGLCHQPHVHRYQTRLSPLTFCLDLFHKQKIKQ